MTKPLKVKLRSLYAVAAHRVLDGLPLGMSILSAPATPVWSPPTDLFECENHYVIRVAVSGLKSTPKGELENADVLVENDIVAIRGSRRDECPLTKHVYYQMEIHYGDFEVRVRVNAPFDRENIRAEYRDGFLQVLIPKAERVLPGKHKIEVAF